MKYRKKPVVIEAYQFLPKGSPVTYPDWMEEARSGLKGNQGSIWCETDGTWYCGTLEGKHEITLGDFIIQGVKGEIYPCKPDIFELTYEKVEEVEVERVGR
jgi:hypothetical protein